MNDATGDWLTLPAVLAARKGSGGFGPKRGTRKRPSVEKKQVSPDATSVSQTEFLQRFASVTTKLKEIGIPVVDARAQVKGRRAANDSKEREMARRLGSSR